jgi:hypothetical protein
LKKSGAKNFFGIVRRDVARPPAKFSKSLFGSFFSEKEHLPRRNVFA